MQRASADNSTMASLCPTRTRELRYAAHKNSVHMYGSHLKLLQRASRAPEISRKYVHGDPVNMIDWRAYARTDQLTIREVHDEAIGRINISFDVSRTMVWPESEGSVPSKHEISARIALHLAYMHLKAGDSVSLWMHDDLDRFPKLNYTTKSASEILEVFDRFYRSGFDISKLSVEFSKPRFNQKPCDVSYWIGDLLGKGDWQAFTALGRRSSVIHVLSSMETDIKWIEKDVCYFDEDASRKEYQGQVLVEQNNYVEGLTRWRKGIEEKLTASGRNYLLVTDKTQIARYERFLFDGAK